MIYPVGDSVKRCRFGMVLFMVHQNSWNLLDLRIRQLPNFESFKYKLKQHYFKKAKHPIPLLL